jgi:hypothetical protein
MGVHLFMSLYVIKGNFAKTVKTPALLS